jgi:hypothetical protein
LGGGIADAEAEGGDAVAVVRGAVDGECQVCEGDRSGWPLNSLRPLRAGGSRWALRSGRYRTNSSSGLIYRTRNSTVPGRVIFQVRNGVVLGALQVNAGADRILPVGVRTWNLSGSASNPDGGSVTVNWKILPLAMGEGSATFSNPNILNPSVTFTQPNTYQLQLTATSAVDPSNIAAVIVEFVIQ